jgi:hypothetical protein
MKPMPTLDTARLALREALQLDWPEIPESDRQINRLSRAIIRAVRRQHGEAHLYAPNGMPNGQGARELHRVYPDRVDLTRRWNTHRWLPGRPEYLLTLIHMHDTGR